MLEIVVLNYSLMLQIFNKKSPSKNLHSNTKITTASEQSLSLPLSANYYAISFLWLNSSLLANNEKAIMAKLCSYYPLHFMQAVIIVNPRSLLYHVRGSREENGVGWCMANWKCHSYLFISSTRPLCVNSRTRACARIHMHCKRRWLYVSVHEHTTHPGHTFIYTLTHTFIPIITNDRLTNESKGNKNE